MSTVRRSRGKERISHEIALAKLALRHLSQKQVDHELVSRAFANAFPKVLDKRFRQSARNVEIFKLYWGFEGEGPLTVREIAPRFDMSPERAHEVVRAIEGRIGHIAQKEFRLLQDQPVN